MSQNEKSNASVTQKVVPAGIDLFKIQMGSKPVSEDQQTRIKAITDQFVILGQTILEKSKAGADQTAAMRKLREAKMTVVDWIASEEWL